MCLGFHGFRLGFLCNRFVQENWCPDKFALRKIPGIFVCNRRRHSGPKRDKQLITPLMKDTSVNPVYACWDSFDVFTMFTQLLGAAHRSVRVSDSGRARGRSEGAALSTSIHTP